MLAAGVFTGGVASHVVLIAKALDYVIVFDIGADGTGGGVDFDALDSGCNGT